MNDALGLIQQLRTFWRRPYYDLNCWTHGHLGRYRTQAEAVSRWQFHVEAVTHQTTVSVHPFQADGEGYPSGSR